MRSPLEIANAVRNQTQSNDRSFHSWYQFVLGYPPHLVRYYLNKFEVNKSDLVLDPFCGTGTTNVECKKQGIDSFGLEANPMAQFAARVKTHWAVSPDELLTNLHQVMVAAMGSFRKFGLSEDASSLFFSAYDNADAILLTEEPSLSDEERKVLPRDFISEQPLRRVLLLKECILQTHTEGIRDLLLLALAGVALDFASNIAFGPEIYTTKPKDDAYILGHFFWKVSEMADDIRSKPLDQGATQVLLGDARAVADYFRGLEGAVSCVITSPPYPNEKDYTRTTRLESILLGFIKGRNDLRELKESLLRSNSRNIFVSDADEECVKSFPSIIKVVEEIEEKRLQLKNPSGFEKLYHKIVRHYFGGMFRHLQSLKQLLAPGARTGLCSRGPNVVLSDSHSDGGVTR